MKKVGLRTPLGLLFKESVSFFLGMLPKEGTDVMGFMLEPMFNV